MDPTVERLRQAGMARSMADAELVAAARAIVDRVRVAELERRGVEPQAGASWTRAVARTVRRTAIGEIEVALGLGAREAGFLVTAATAPGETYGDVDAALRRGEVTWPLVRELYEKTAPLEDDQRSLVTTVLLGTDPQVAAAERLDPDGALHGRPWSVPRYRAALEAEVTACKGTDTEAERAARARAYEARRLATRVHDDGTATMYIRGPVTAVVAAGERIERGARSVRALGDPRTLDQLRVDIALGLLIYATVALGDGKAVNPSVEDHDVGSDSGAAATGDETATCSCTGEGAGGQGVLFDELIAPDDMELLARVVNALPPVALQVVVPWATLAGGFPVCAHCSGPLDATRPQPSAPAGGAAGHHPDDPGEKSARDRDHEDEGRDPSAGEESAPDREGVADRRDPSAGQESVPDRDDVADRRDPSAGEESVPDHLPRRGRGRGGVAEVLGANPFFITDGHARELALMPGTTMHRLVTDLRDGRLAERTIKGYKPDADMRRQVVAADVYSRAPGARVGSHAGELDHVTPHGWAGGPTGELNLALLAKRPHQYKTDGIWHAEIGARRDLTFTTLLGQVVTTRAHDYRTYIDQRGHEDLAERRDRAGQLLLAALADETRTAGRSRRDSRGRGRRRDRLTLDHTDPETGRTRAGPRPDQPTLDALLGQDGTEVPRQEESDGEPRDGR